jgi:hypothetical protein
VGEQIEKCYNEMCPEHRPEKENSCNFECSVTSCMGWMKEFKKEE